MHFRASLLFHLALILIRTVPSSACLDRSENNITEPPYVTDLEALLAAVPVLGDVTGALSNWNEANKLNACCWTGVTCGNSPLRVTFINLQYVTFSGTLPPQFGALTSLKGLYMSGCSLRGPIPQSWEKLTELSNLELYSNFLNGTLDPLRNLVQLTSLSLSFNNLTGDMGNLPIENIKGLTQLYLGSNLFTGSFPQWISQMANLTELGLQENQLTPSKIPSGNFVWPSSINTLKLNLMNLVGQIPNTLVSIPSLRYLDLNNNNLNGTVPNAFRGNIVEISLAYNNLTGDIPDTLLTLNLTDLNISSNGFEGRLPDFLNCSGLLSIDLSQNKLNGPISSNFLIDSTKVQSVNLSQNKLNEAIDSSFLSGKKRLSKLDLSFNLLVGDVPPSLFHFQRLSNLNIRDNLLSLPDTLNPNSVKSNLTLQVLNVGNTSLKTLPPWVSYFSRLQELYMDNNKLIGPLPAFLGTLSFLQILDLSNNGFNSTIPDTFGDSNITYDTSLDNFRLASFLGLSTLNLSRCNLSGHIPERIGKLPRLSTLDLSHNSFNGNITDFSASSMEYLDLSHNFLSGSVPETLANLQIKHVNLSFNNLTGFIPDSVLALFNNCDSIFPGNINLKSYVDCDNGIFSNILLPPPPPPSPPPPSPTTLILQGSNSGFPVYAIILCALGGLLLFTIVSIFYFIQFQKEQKNLLTIKIQEHFVKFISLDAIREATNNFSDDNKLGGGAFGIVYKGLAKNGEQWAVKRTKRVSEEGLEEFKNEVDMMSRMNHKNLVKLLGFCDADNEQILVYEFVSNGTLKEALMKGILTFEQRLEIALGTSEGLRYLHTEAKPNIIHRDVKSENILLDDEMRAKVADFGLLKDNEDKDKPDLRTRVAGTHGYMDPEYYTTFRVTPKSDVYSFGVVLLELITGQPALLKDTESMEGPEPDLIALSSWATQRMRTKLGLAAIVDASMDSIYPLDEMESMASIAASCLQKVSKFRPEMADVASQLRLLKSKLEKNEGFSLQSAVSVGIQDDEEENSVEISVERRGGGKGEGGIYPPIIVSDESSLGSTIIKPVPKGSVLEGR